MGLILDFVFLALVLVCCAIGYKKGVVKSFLGFVAYLLAMVGSVALGSVLATALYNGLLRNVIVEKATQALTETTAQTATEQIDAVIKSLPGVLTSLMEKAGITASSMTGLLDGSIEPAANKFADLVGPAVISISRVFITAILFAVLLSVLLTVVRAVAAVFRMPLFRQADHLLGGLFGILNGSIVVLVCCVLLGLWVPMTKDGFLGITQTDLEQSYAYQIIYHSNPVYSLLGEE